MSDLVKYYRQLIGIAKSWAEKNLPHWDDEIHRDLLSRHGAVEMNDRVSASTMNVPQLAAVLDDYERRGWPRRRQVFARNNVNKKVPARIAMIVRLWGKLGQSGKVDKATRPALLAWCSRMLRREITNLDSLSVDDCRMITEALKKYLAR